MSQYGKDVTIEKRAIQLSRPNSEVRATFEPFVCVRTESDSSRARVEPSTSSKIGLQGREMS